MFKFLLRCGKKAGRFWKPLFNHLIQVHVGLKIFFKFGRQMFEKIKFSNLVHTKVLKMSRFFNFLPFAPTCANFHLLYVALLEVENFLAYSKCLQQAAVKIQKLVRIRTPEPWEVEKKLKKKLWPEGGSIWGPLACKSKALPLSYQLLLKKNGDNNRPKSS